MSHSLKETSRVPVVHEESTTKGITLLFRETNSKSFKPRNIQAITGKVLKSRGKVLKSRGKLLKWKVLEWGVEMEFRMLKWKMREWNGGRGMRERQTSKSDTFTTVINFFKSWRENWLATSSSDQRLAGDLKQFYFFLCEGKFDSQEVSSVLPSLIYRFYPVLQHFVNFVS